MKERAVAECCPAPSAEPDLRPVEGKEADEEAAVVRAYELARAAGLTVGKPPRTTWRGTPLHELWLEDPDGNLVEIYARLTPDELAEKPESLEPTVLT